MQGTVSALAQSGIGLGVRKGSPKPDISTFKTLRETLLAAKSITYSDPAAGGASGIHFAKVLDRLGIADAIRPKIVFHPPSGSVVRLIVEGKAEIGVHQLQELASDPGVEIVGPLPGDLQLTVIFAGAVMAVSKEATAAKALLTFLRSPEATSVMKQKGLSPI